jgi:hypothetical protein
MNNQLGGGGARWGIAEAGKISWIGGDTCESNPVEPWMPGIAVSQVSRPNGSTAVLQTFAAAEDDVLVFWIGLLDFGEASDVVWHADFSPRGVVLPELAALGEAAPRDFAAYTKDGRIYHFRPKNPGRKEWGTAAAGDWEEFADSEGVWIVMASRESVRASCGVAGGDRSAASGVAGGAVGDCDSALFLRPLPVGGGYEATVFAAFGGTRVEAEAALERVIDADFDGLYAHASGYWGRFGVTAGAPRSQQDLVIVGMAIDRTTGGFTRAPGGSDCPALCYTRDCAWASMALDLAGREEEAGQVVSFAASTVRKEQRRGKPIGSLPLAVYSDGTEAAPHLALDADAPAYVLGAIWKHAAAIGDDGRRMEFLESVWAAASLMADFVGAWTDSRTREPLYSFDCVAGRDQQGPARLLTSYMGIDAALRIARAAGRPEPADWARRKVELDTLIRFQLVDRQSRTWKAGPILPYWHDAMAEDWSLKGSPLPSWDAAVESLIRDRGGDRSEIAATAALVWRGVEGRAGEVASAMEEAWGVEGDLDAVRAAERIITNYELRITNYELRVKS